MGKLNPIILNNMNTIPNYLTFFNFLIQKNILHISFFQKTKGYESKIADLCVRFFMLFYTKNQITKKEAIKYILSFYIISPQTAEFYLINLEGLLQNYFVFSDNIIEISQSLKEELIEYVNQKEKKQNEIGK